MDTKRGVAVSSVEVEGVALIKANGEKRRVEVTKVVHYSSALSEKLSSETITTSCGKYSTDSHDDEKECSKDP